VNAAVETRFRAVEERVGRIEATGPEVVAARLDDLVGEVRWVRRWIVALTVSLLCSAVGAVLLLVLRG
jgi:hypothetical protein